MKHIKEKKERALGIKLFLKAERCNSPKCAMVRNPNRPGFHGQKRHTVSEYAKQLNEKQKIQVLYGLNNRQMQNLFRKNSNKEKILESLEHRLDHVVFLLGFASSPRVARQIVSHGHISVNKRKVTIPSFRVKVGDTISIKEESRKLKIFEELNQKLKKHSVPSWLSIDSVSLSGSCTRKFHVGETKFPFDINLVGEFYSR